MRLTGDSFLCHCDFEKLECGAKEVALMVMGKAIERRLNSDHSDKSEEGEFCGCGKMAEYLGRRKKQFITVLGPMELERASQRPDAGVYKQHYRRVRFRL